MPKVLIIAGESSGDIHGAKLMQAMKAKSPEIEFVGIGGNEMTKQGLNSLAKLEDIAVVGFWEVAKRYSYFSKLLNTVEELLKQGDISIFLPIDYPGFNLRIAAKAKALHIPVAYYIAPQLWAWGKDRAKKLAANTDLLMVVFPFEEQFFGKEGINTKFVGHPLLDDPIFSAAHEDFDRDKNLIGLFPGSRKQEVIKHLPLYNEIGKEIKLINPKLKLGISVATTVGKDFLTQRLDKSLDWELFYDSRELMTKSYAGVVKSGTSNLEAALLGLPFSLIYKTSPITYHMGKRLINLDYLSIVNILRNKEVVKEFIQQFATAKDIAKEIVSLIENAEKRATMEREFRFLKQDLGQTGAAANAANLILEHL